MPLFGKVSDSIGYIRYRSRTFIQSVNLMNVCLDVPDCHSFGVHEVYFISIRKYI